MLARRRSFGQALIPPGAGMSQPRPKRLISRDTHTTRLPQSVVQEAIQLLGTGSVQQRMRAAQLLASAYDEDEARRRSAAAQLSGMDGGLQDETDHPAGAEPLPPPGCGFATEER